MAKNKAKAADQPQPDVILPGGRQIFYDFTKITVREWREMASPLQSDDEGNTILCKVTGITDAELQEMTVQDQRILVQGMYVAYRNPLPVTTWLNELT